MAVVETRLLEQHGAVVRWNGLLGVGVFLGFLRCDTVLTLLSRRKNVCGSPILKPYTIFSRALVIFTRNHTPSGNGIQWSWTGVSPRSRASRLSHLVQSTPTFTPGDIHKRQRRVMTPAFGPFEAKALYPYFTQCSNAVSHYLLRF